MVKLTAPESIVLGQPFSVSFAAEQRVAGRVRLTSGTDLVEFTLAYGEREPTTGTSHRIRGRQGTLAVSEWGSHEVGTELVLRFEGAKAWLKVEG